MLARPDTGVEVVAVNDLATPQALAHLLKYDSTYGRLDLPVTVGSGELIVGGHRIKILTVADPADLEWGVIGVDVVIESTGRFPHQSSCRGPPDRGRPQGRHLRAGQGRRRDSRDRRERGGL